MGLLVALLWQSRCALWRLSWCLGKTKLRFENFVEPLCFILVFQMWHLETSVVTEFSFHLHLFDVELLDIQCDTVFLFGICFLRCLSDLSLSTCEIQLFHSSTGLIVLSARPTHPICGGGTL